jgi:diguanylate cyclase (GGDEF)-like protein
MEDTGVEQVQTFRLSEGKTPFHNILYLWRWYTLGREQYQECINKIFINNLSSLSLANKLIIALAGCFALFPIFIENNLSKALPYFATALIAFLLAVLADTNVNRSKRGKIIHNRVIYLLIALYYANLILFGIYLSVLSSPDNYAVSFMCILICALFLFIQPPLFNLSVTLGAIVIFAVSTVLVKSYHNWSIDILNALFAGIISLFVNWHISKLRLTALSNVSKLEDERNRYYDQSTIDELTQLRNRRDFTQTFQRYLSSYRTSDYWLCVAIFDIDFFKKYNDHYGHTKGDDCLRTIGGMLNTLRDTMNLYSARVGGEEFAMLWFENDLHHVNTVVARLNALVRELKIPHEKSRTAPYVSISTGVYVEPCGTSSDMRTLYDLADKALYFAKGSGRNCAIISGKDFDQYKITPVFQETTV